MKPNPVPGARGRPPGRPPLNRPVAGTTTTTGTIGSTPWASDAQSSLTQEQRSQFNKLIQDLREGKLPLPEFQVKVRSLLGDRMFQAVMANMQRIAGGATGGTNIAGNIGQIPRSPTTASPLIRPAADTSSVVMDSAALQDVIQYAGVDLKAEADLILGRALGAGAAAGAGAAGLSAISYAGLSAAALRDDRVPDRFLNVARLKAVLVQSARHYNLQAVDPQCVDALAAVLLKKLSMILVSLVRYSRQRVDLTRRFYKIKVENDPKKQMWLLEQILTFNQVSQQPGGVVSPSPPNLMSPPSQPPPNTLTTSSQDASASKKRKASSSSSQQPDESMIKTKLTNITALQAIGLKRKSWMTSSSSNAMAIDESEEENNPIDGGSGDSKTEKSPAPMGSHHTTPMINMASAPSASPLTERELFERFINRSITVKDLMRYLEMDEPQTHHYRTLILHGLYHLPG